MLSDESLRLLSHLRPPWAKNEEMQLDIRVTCLPEMPLPGNQLLMLSMVFLVLGLVGLFHVKFNFHNVDLAHLLFTGMLKTVQIGRPSQ